MSKVVIFTDGASRGNPGPGGWGAIIVFGGQVVELGGREDVTTNNRMELKAVISALNHAFNVLKIDSEPVIYTDSSYVLKGATDWLKNWRKNNWTTSGKSEVVNKDLWQTLAEILDRRKISWHLVSGHVGVAGNERADIIATNFADEGSLGLFSGNLADYGIDILNIASNTEKRSARGSSKLRSRSAAYSYVSMVDGKIKTHKTWAECEGRVKGVSGAVYKKSLSSDEERQIIAEFEGRKS